jgi:hypothetical protein
MSVDAGLTVVASQTPLFVVTIIFVVVTHLLSPQIFIAKDYCRREGAAVPLKQSKPPSYNVSLCLWDAFAVDNGLFSGDSLVVRLERRKDRQPFKERSVILDSSLSH